MILQKSLCCILILAAQGFFIKLACQWPTQVKEVHFENLSVGEILDSLSSNFNVNFSYNAGLEIIQQRKSIHKEATLEQILQCVLKDPEIEFSIIDKQVIIYKVIKPVAGKSTSEEKTIYRQIQGRIFQKGKHEALSFASVSTQKGNITTVANNDGYFKLKIPNENLTDSLEISYIGYTSQSFLINDIPDSAWTIELQEYVTTIDPVHIKLISGEDIVKEAISKIIQNYPRKNNMCTAFYREIVNEDAACISLNEALLDIAKAPYTSLILNDQARIFKGRKQENVKKMSKLDFKLEGGIYNSLRLDIIKEEAAFFTQEGMKNYNYNYKKVIQYNGKNLHVIAFNAKKGVDDVTFEGTLYIDVQSKALVGARFKMSPDGLKYARSQLIKKQPKKSKIKPVDAGYIALYRYINGKYYLHYTRAELVIKAKSDRLFIDSKYEAIAELAITEIDTLNTSRFKWSDIAKSHDILNDRLQVYDDSYWGSYNIIPPSEQIQKAQTSFQLLKGEE